MRICEGEKLLHFDDPTVLALAALGVFRPYSAGMLDSFVEAGGVSAVMPVLKSSSCQTTLTCTAGLVGGLLADAYTLVWQDPTWSLEKARALADEFYNAGGSNGWPSR